MKIYKSQIMRWDRNISIGDIRKVDGEWVKIISIVKIDTDEMILYFHGIPLEEINEEFEDIDE
jgi:hypothetical protein